MIVHPIIPTLNGKSLKKYKDPNGVYLFNDMVKLCHTNGSGVVKYKWLNPKSKKIEDKISYVFTFKPYHWIIGTGEYVSVLQKNLKQDVIDIVRKLRYGKNNYFFIYNYQHIAIAHPYIQGKDMSLIQDAKGNLIVPHLVKIAREKGEGFTRYWWKKNSKDTKAYEKLTFVKNFPNWKMVIATGIFIDDIDKEINTRRKDLVQKLRILIDTTTIGKTGYLYIMDKKGKMIIHPNKNIDGKSIADLKNPLTNRLMFDDLVKASKTPSKMLYYKWDKPNDKENYIYNKVSWTQYIPEFQWYISSTIYLDELEQSSKKVSHFVLLLASLIFIFAIIASVLFFNKLLTPITKLSNLAKKVAKGDYSVRSDISQNNEIGELSNSFNTMIDITEDLILNLDAKIKERTKALEDARKNIEHIHKQTRDSIEYAALIQNAILPDDTIYQNYFKDSFVFWQPKDTVGGDIWLFNDLRNKDECLILFIDCTGHGVPGAFVSMIVKAVEREVASILIQDDTIEISPAWIMGYFNRAIKQLLRQETDSSISNAGWDGGIIYYNRKTQIVKFAGAETPLFYIDENKKLKTIKGDRYSVGYKKCSIDYKYKETIIKVKEGMKFFCTIDGYLDQNGGEKDFPFGKKRFCNIIKENTQTSMKDIKKIFIDEIIKYEKAIPDNERNDDITIIGFEIGSNLKKISN